MNTPNPNSPPRATGPTSFGTGVKQLVGLIFNEESKPNKPPAEPIIKVNLAPTLMPAHMTNPNSPTAGGGGDPNCKTNGASRTQGNLDRMLNGQCPI
jgi:hypothetical protein